MMRPFRSLTAIAAPMAAANIDTDQIIPKQYLSTIERTGLGRGLFHDQRWDAQGNEKPDFLLNQPKYRLAQILLAGANFGCGSSREHAPWALVDFGIRCVIAPSFADIFYNNCFNNGVLPAIVSQTDLDLLVAEAAGDCFVVDLEPQTIAAPSGVHVNFEIEPGRKAKLLGGLDDIAVTLQQEAAIRAFEGRPKPWE